MRILFVYPNVTRATCPQLGICMLAATAKQLGHGCALYDLTSIRPGKEIFAFQSQLKSSVADVLAVSCRSNEWSFVDTLLRSVDVGNILKIFGGPHATVAPEEVIGLADIVVLGEGEETFAELLKRIAGGGDIANVAGCWIKQGGGIIKNEMRNLISDLDELPFPSWEIFDGVHYYDSCRKTLFKGAKVVGTFEGSRGCPYACTYCINDEVRTLYKGKGKWRREKSPERIVQEVAQFREQYGLDGVFWADEVFLTNVERLERFRDLYRSQIGVPFGFMERPENMTDEKIRIIKEAGAQMVSIGIESGDENIRRNLLNRHHSQETIVSAFRTARKYGLTTHAFTMTGFPGEDKRSMEDTYRLVRQAQPDTVQTTIFYPLRGTKLFELVVQGGFLDSSTPMPNTYYGESSLTLPERQKKELIRHQYLVTYYNSRMMRLFVRAHLGQFFLRLLALFFRVSTKFRQEGIRSTLKAIARRIRILRVKS